MEDFKDALEKAKEELTNSDDISCGFPVDADLYHLREAVRILITCMEQVSVEHKED